MSDNRQPLIVHVFGKKTCAKCALLNKRLDDILTKDPWTGHFIKVYNDLETEDGLTNFCLAQCINPNRVPAMVIARLTNNDEPDYLPNPKPDSPNPVCKKAALYTCLGIQTDYSAEGKGLITPRMIQDVLNTALAIQ